MPSPRPSWRPLLAGTIALFFIILAFLAGQVKAGGDPALGSGGGNAATQQAAPPSGSGGGDDGFIPGGTEPAPPVPDGSQQQPQGSTDAPSTHQS